MKKIAIGVLALLSISLVSPATGVETDPAYLQIGADYAWAKGYKGKDAVIAIFERGIDLDHPAFKDRVIDGYCIVTEGAPDQYCANGKKEMSGIDAAQRPSNDAGHGLGVAGAAASNPTIAGPGGVAPEAKLLMVRAEGGDVSIMAALEKVIELKAKYNIVAVNMSFARTALSTRDATGDCDANLNLRPFKAVLKRVREAGIVTFAASGNLPTKNDNLSTFPACVSEVVSVGSTDKLGQIGNYVTASEKIAVFAPDFPMVPRNVGYGVMGGTSTATPVAVGAFAVLRQAFPNESIDRVLLAMSSAGRPIEDKWIKGKHEINLKTAIDFLGRANPEVPIESPSPTPKPVCQASLGTFAPRTIGKAVGATVKVNDGCDEGNTLKVNGTAHFTWFGSDPKLIELPAKPIKTVEIISGDKSLRKIDYSACKLTVVVVKRPSNGFATTVNTACEGLLEVRVNNIRVWITPMEGFARSMNLSRTKGQVANYFFMGNLKATLSDAGLKVFP